MQIEHRVGSKAATTAAATQRDSQANKLTTNTKIDKATVDEQVHGTKAELRTAQRRRRRPSRESDAANQAHPIARRHHPRRQRQGTVIDDVEVGFVPATDVAITANASTTETPDPAMIIGNSRL